MSGYDFNTVRGKIFLEHLNNVYTSKVHLETFLPEMQGFVTQPNLSFAIEEFKDDNKQQVTSLDDLYVSIRKKFVPQTIIGIRVIALEAYKAAISETLDPLERDCAIILCMQSIDSIEIVYYKNLCMMADQFNVNHMKLRVPFDCALDNLLLFHDVFKDVVS